MQVNFEIVRQLKNKNNAAWNALIFMRAQLESEQ
jgi:hypothetical protein